MGLFARLRGGISSGILEKEDELSSTRLENSKAKVWAIGGGKGGIGKSFFASSIGILLSRRGKKVLLVDTDLGAANLHTFIKAENSKMSLSSFLIYGDSNDLPSLISKTSVPNLDLISGARDSLDVADFTSERLKRLEGVLSDVDYDYVILDVGPGTSSGNLDLFSMADKGIVIITPEPTAIENTYRFLKCLYSRRLKNIITSGAHKELASMLKTIFSNGGGNGYITIAKIAADLEKMGSEQAKKFKSIIGDGRISMVVNQARTPEDRDLGASLQRACLDYFGLKIGYAGYVYYENSIYESIRERKPLIIHRNKSGAARSIEICLLRLLDSDKQ